jgi:hypothetical protein
VFRAKGITMLKNSLHVLLLLASCSGGGSSTEPPFNASSDVMATHPWMPGYWDGTFSDGVAGTFAARLGASIVNSGSYGFPTVVTTPGDPGFPVLGYGSMECDGDRVRVDISDFNSYGRSLHISAIVQSAHLMVGTWDLAFDGNASANRHGTLSLTKTESPHVTVDTYESPDLLLIVRREWR